MPSITEKKRIVAKFLVHCNDYATQKVARYREQLDEAKPDEVLSITDKIGHWTAYRAFNDYTIRELDTDELDDWFRD